MKRLVLVFSLFSILALISCSSDVAGGGDDFPNSKVVGIIVDSGGNPASDVEVELIPYNFDPAKDLESRIYKDTSDDKGQYSIDVDVKSIYTLSAYEKSTGKRLLRFDVPVFLDNNNPGKDTLKATGAVNCIFPDSVVDDGYVYIRGTRYLKDIHEGVKQIDGKYSVQIDSIPEVQLPTVSARTVKTVVLGNLVNVSATDTVPVGDTATLPLWEFNLLIGVSANTATHYGSVDQFVSKVQTQIRDVMNKFNYPGVFNGVLSFVIDSVYLFTQNDTLEEKTDWKSYSAADYRIIYDAFSVKTISTYGSSHKTISMVSSDPDSLFTYNKRDALVWFLGLARGCFGLNWMAVKAECNPINGQDYLGVKTIMNMPYGETFWDEYSINVINYYGENIYEGKVLDTRLMPDTIIVNAVTELGVPLDNAEIDVYQVGIGDYTVESVPQISGITNKAGQFILPVNPYDADGDGRLAALNCLVTSIHEGDTAYYWMPITDAVNSFMDDENKPYNVIVTH